MKHLRLHIDIETYSSEDLSVAGVYRYAESPDFKVLLFAYAWDEEPVQVVDLASGEELPDEVRSALADHNIGKYAYNAAFERVCLSRWLGVKLDVRQWHCVMVAAARLSLPLPLGACADALGIAQGKMTEGRALIRKFSRPNSKGNRVLPGDAPEDWTTFKAYCVRDVEVERSVLHAVQSACMPGGEEAERRLYIADQEINDRGVAVDVDFVRSAARLDSENRIALLEEAKALTGLENPNSPMQIKEWLRSQINETVSSIRKADLSTLLTKHIGNRKVRRFLEIRQALGKTSTAKYPAILSCMTSDGRVHGLLQFYGATRTGRWAGRLVQLQNLPQNHLDDLDGARRCVLDGDTLGLNIWHGDTAQVLSELVRTSFIAPEGRTLHVCDFSAIEARVVAWLAGEDWVLDVFRNGGDIYCATASQMFGVPVEKHGANSGLRQRGKVAVLALGYGGGIAALEAMGAGRMGLSESEMQDIVDKWRKANPHIVKLWTAVERAATEALSRQSYTRPVQVYQKGSTYDDGSYKAGRGVHRGIHFVRKGEHLFARLPSGRYLCYPYARLDEDEKRRVGIVYKATNQTTGKWDDTRTYGGKLVENLVQATARDILGEVLLRTYAAGMRVVFHVHDEIVVESDQDVTLERIEKLFSIRPLWAMDLPLKGAGYSTPYYKKD